MRRLIKQELLDLYEKSNSGEREIIHKAMELISILEELDLLGHPVTAKKAVMYYLGRHTGEDKISGVLHDAYCKIKGEMNNNTSK